MPINFVDDFSRVKLSLVEKREGSDYINASYIDVSACTLTFADLSVVLCCIAGLQAGQCIHSNTGAHAQHHRRLLEDDLGTQADRSHHAD